MLPVKGNDVVLVYLARPAAARSAVNQEGFVTGETLVLASLADITAAPAHLANAEAGSLRKRGDSGA